MISLFSKINTYKFKKHLSLALASLLLPTSVVAAGYDIWLYDLSYNKQQQRWTLGHGQVVSNRDGYDNQPAFTHDSQALLFASDRSGAHNDIYRYQLDNNNIRQLTDTPNQSEFSPQPMASGIRYVVEQGVPHQSVWVQPENQNRQRGINSYIPTGYYAHHPELGTLLWARYAYSIYFEPTGEEANESHFVMANAGRSLHAIPEHKAFSYLHKQQDGARVIKHFDPLNNSHTNLIAVGSGSEDYGWSHNGWIFNINQNQLRSWRYQPGQPNTTTWQAVGDLTPPSKNHFGASRVAISPDNRHIAIVWQRE